MRNIGFGMFVLLWLAGIAFAAYYLLWPDILPYHAEAMGGTDAQLPPRIVTLYFALRIGIAVVTIALSIVCAYLLFFRIRQGDEVATLAFVLAQTVTSVGSGLIAWHVHTATGAHAPWQLGIVLWAVLMLACFLWLPSNKPR